MYLQPVIRLKRRGPIAEIVLDDPARHNALGCTWPEEMMEIVGTIATENTFDAVIVTGAGSSFSSGLNLDDLANERLSADFFQRAEDARVALEQLDRPVIAGIHGHCLGGGLQLALACDDRIATADARIGLPAAQEVLLPGMALHRLPRTLGVGRSLRMILSGETLDADTAMAHGLVSQVVPPGQLGAALEELAMSYAALPTPLVRGVKRLVRQAHDLPLDEFRKEFDPAMNAVLTSPAHQEARRKWRARHSTAEVS